MFSALPYDRLLLQRTPVKGDRGSRLWKDLLEAFEESAVPILIPRVTPVLIQFWKGRDKGEERG